jgi:hypothetical protein
MTITYRHPDLFKDDVKVAQISPEKGVILITNAKLGGTVKGAIKRELDVEDVTWRVVAEFPPHQTRSESQAVEAVRDAAPPAPSLPGSYVEGGITIIPCSSLSEEGWVGPSAKKVFKQ